MHIEHLAIWTNRLETMRAFYEKYFNGRAGARYTNSRTGFQSYFLTFASGARLELMQMDGIPPNQNDPVQQYTGIIHLAFATGSGDAVDELTDRLRREGYHIAGEPRTTGDGYYESVILDPDGNRIEIVA